MAMPEAIYTPLKEKLADTKVTVEGTEVLLIDVIAGKEGWYEKSVHAKKIQDNNADLTKQRDEWEKSEKEYKAKQTELETEIDKAKENQLTVEERKEFLNIKKKGMTDDVSAKFNALEVSNKELSEKIGALTSDLENEKKTSTEAKFNGAKKSLDNKILTTLAEHRIEGTKADAALAIMHAKGFIGISKNDDGTFNEKFRIFKDNKELESNLNKMVETFAKDNEYLVSGTKTGGTGTEHTSANSKGNEQSPMQLLNSEKKGYDN